MGPILALGIAVMVVAGLTPLPAILGTLGRRAFWPAVPREEAGPRPVSAIWARVGRGRPAPRQDGGAGHARPARRHARQPRRARGARLLGGLPHAARVRRRRGAHQRAVHPWPRRPDRGRDGLRGPRDRDLAPDRWPHDTGPGDVPVRRLGPDAGRSIGAGAGAGLPEDEPVLRCGHRLGAGAAACRPRSGRRLARAARRRGARGLRHPQSARARHAHHRAAGPRAHPAHPRRAAARRRDAAVRDRDGDPVVRRSRSA